MLALLAVREIRAKRGGPSDFELSKARSGQSISREVHPHFPQNGGPGGLSSM